MKRSAQRNLFGFTLVELLVVVGILAVLTIALILIFNPTLQIQRFQNGQRKQDLTQIKNALDVYYNDHGCYPTSVPFGAQWLDGENVLMKQVPQDPNVYCVSASECYPYAYITDNTSDCPQWGVVFAKLSGTSTQLSTNSTTSCTSPTGQTLGGQHSYKCETCPIHQICGFSVIHVLGRYNYCQLLGSINSEMCSIIDSVTFVSRDSFTTTTISSSTTTTTAVSTTTTSTTTTTTLPEGYGACTCAEASYAIGGGGLCNFVPAGTGTHCLPATPEDPYNCIGLCNP